MRAIMGLIICCVAVAAAFDGPNELARPSKSQTPADRDAPLVWEQAIAAKGGRERLYAVRNILESYKNKRFVALYVFPDKFWRWADDRPTPLGIYIAMDNPQGKMSYRIEEDTPSPPQNLGERNAREGMGNLLRAALLLAGNALDQAVSGKGLQWEDWGATGGCGGNGRAFP
jgi:hypothetical protein